MAVHMARWMSTRTLCGRRISHVACAHPGEAITCKRCVVTYGADHRRPATEETTCPHCSGYGVRSDVPGYIGGAKPCPRCCGSGRVAEAASSEERA